MTLPHDHAAERTVLGAILLRPEVFGDIVAIAIEDDFHVPAHRCVFRAMCKLADAGTPIDAVSLERQVRDAGELNIVGGPEGVSDLTRTVVSSYNALGHARRVRDMAGVRRTVELAARLAEDGRGSEASQDPIGWIEQSAHRLAEAGHVHRDDSGVDLSQLCSEYIPELVARKEGKREGIMSGLPDLDAIAGGFQPGDLIVIGARPGIGKSALACNIARNSAVQRGIPVRFFSLEMTAKELMDRLVSEHSKVKLTALRAGQITRTESETVIETLSRFHRSPLSIDDRSQLPIHAIAASARAWRRDRKRGGSHERALVIVDYVQIARPSRHHHNREQEIAEISSGLKALAKDIQAPVIALAQLNREAEERRPVLKDFRESGALEQDANIAIFIHRSGARNDDPNKPPGDTELIVAKNRNGPTGIAKVQYDGFHTRFYSVENRQEYVR
jgi:replicative DNA helicase